MFHRALRLTRGTETYRLANVELELRRYMRVTEAKRSQVRLGAHSRAEHFSHAIPHAKRPCILAKSPIRLMQLLVAHCVNLSTTEKCVVSL